MRPQFPPRQLVLRETHDYVPKDFVSIPKVRWDGVDRIRSQLPIKELSLFHLTQTLPTQPLLRRLSPFTIAAHP